MKAESEAPQTPAPAQTQPVTQYTAQWGTAHIPIDPALQQQSQHATTTAYSHYQYSQHYPQAAYAHYQYVPSPITTQAQMQQRQQAAATTTPATVANTTSATATSGVDTADVATLNDALGSAGVARATRHSVVVWHIQACIQLVITFRSLFAGTNDQTTKSSISHFLTEELITTKIRERKKKASIVGVAL
ncbi:hypothetical protein PAXINDRAFT_156576 [Paxillus involutus ATCC 200175]|uniref:Uncharacterized protein n=1 Tax=Paxillus involutus ATCC 200175 TaxID=664439 RepID=A0A0C9TSI9_PAXIN|nr:hypothetical protein PAXINDRAFT_156576 [Paxillus involutus ATCC 200175]